MLINNNDKRKMKNNFDMLALSENGVETYFMCNNIDYRYYNSIVNNNRNRKITFTNKGLNELKTRAMIEFEKYDLLMFFDEQDYDILTLEKLKGYAKIIALDENKEVTAAYYYNTNSRLGKPATTFFYASPTYSNSELIELNDNFSVNDYLDLLAYKHNERTDRKNCQKIYKKY